MSKQPKSPSLPKSLTGKQQAMIAERLKDKKASNAEIIKRAGYNVKGNGNKATNTASQIYLENMRRPEIAKRLNDVVDEMEEVLTDTVRRYKDSDKLAEVALANDNAKWIHDKVKGKATQQIDVNSVAVTLNIDLNSAMGTE